MSKPTKAETITAIEESIAHWERAERGNNGKYNAALRIEVNNWRTMARLQLDNDNE